MLKFYALVLVLLLAFVNYPKAQDYKDSTLSVDARIEDLLSRMTTDEKFRQLFMIPGDLNPDSSRYYSGLFGFQVNTVGQNAQAAQQLLNYSDNSSAYETANKINEIQRYFIEESRLGIPIIAFDEALHGLVRSGATAFPQAIALAATWNPELVHELASAIAIECKTRGIRQILSPVVNIASDVRWGRTEETYGEDPFLVSSIGVAFITALEQNGLIATPKHFVANVGDGGRDSYPIHWNERYMREIHYPPFKSAIVDAGARSIMTAYNSYDGIPCTAHDYLINDLLKDEWGFEGFVISDAGATGGANVLHFTACDYPDATAKSIKAGLDVIFQTHIDHEKLFAPPFLNDSIAPSVIDEAVKRVLRAKFELGLFENPYIEPQDAAYWNGHETHRELAKKAALESVVLLKNSNQTLPLSKEIKTLAVIGPDANEARLGGYSGPGNDPVSILAGIRNLLDNQVAIHYHKGCERQYRIYETIPSSSLSHNIDGKEFPGLKAEYFDNIQFKGDPLLTRSDLKIEFHWTLFSPEPTKLENYDYSVRWSGKILAPNNGRYKVGIKGNDGYRVFINNELLVDSWTKQSNELRWEEFNFVQDEWYDILIEFYHTLGNAEVNLVWNQGLESETESREIGEAVEIARKSDAAVVVVGIDEGEFLDRAYLSLPGSQEELIKRVAATGTPCVVILVGGSAITMNAWKDQVNAILMAWYPGEEGGNAVAEIIFGDYSPAGRLPITFPIFEGQLPLVYNHKPTGRGDYYINLSGEPLFPFGYGLSYSNFEYSDLEEIPFPIRPDESVKLAFVLSNTGNFDADEVIQLYVRDELSSVARPLVELKAFQRVHLKKGESKRIEFELSKQAFTMLDENLREVTEPGLFRIMIGSSSKDIRLQTKLNLSAFY